MLDYLIKGLFKGTIIDNTVPVLSLPVLSLPYYLYCQYLIVIITVTRICQLFFICLGFPKLVLMWRSWLANNMTKKLHHWH